MNSLIERSLVLLFLTINVLCNSASASDCWQRRSDPPIAARTEHGAVWTGTEMIVWGGRGGDDVYWNDGARYNPATNTWALVTATGAPSARYRHSAVWTGTEMIVWGGGQGSRDTLNTGGRYNPVTDTWTAVTTTGAPTARMHHTGVWTGTEMIVWGGYDGGSAKTGGRYNPATNSWTPTSTLAAPAGRYRPTAVWTGTELIVWGGVNTDAVTVHFDTGGRYNPALNVWTTMSVSAAPLPRQYHSAVWTGSEMIVWGGFGDDRTLMNSGGRYDPATDGWTALNTVGSHPVAGSHAVVWTGTEMIVWGGSNFGVALDTGARYNPASDVWTAVTAGEQPARQAAPAVWTGSEMIVAFGRGNPDSVLHSDTFSYTLDCDVFRIAGLVHDNGNLILSFPSQSGRTYTLWRSDNLADGTWTDTGLPSLPGNDANQAFTIAAPVAGVPERFYRVQAAP